MVTKSTVVAGNQNLEKSFTVVLALSDFTKTVEAPEVAWKNNEVAWRCDS